MGDTRSWDPEEEEIRRVLGGAGAFVDAWFPPEKVRHLTTLLDQEREEKEKLKGALDGIVRHYYCHSCETLHNEEPSMHHLWDTALTALGRK